MSGRTVLVCGSRHCGNREAVFRVLNELHAAEPIGLLVHGGAKGADELAEAWQRRHGVPARRFNADWLVHGHAAGPMRNQRMLDEARPILVVAFPSVPCGPGTADMLRRARAAGVEVLEVRT